jgi:hypothetical protein
MTRTPDYRKLEEEGHAQARNNMEQDQEMVIGSQKATFLALSGCRLWDPAKFQMTTAPVASLAPPATDLAPLLLWS